MKLLLGIAAVGLTAALSYSLSQGTWDDTAGPHLHAETHWASVPVMDHGDRMIIVRREIPCKQDNGLRSAERMLVLPIAKPAKAPKRRVWSPTARL